MLMEINVDNAIEKKSKWKKFKSQPIVYSDKCWTKNLKLKKGFRNK